MTKRGRTIAEWIKLLGDLNNNKKPAKQARAVKQIQAIYDEL